MIIKAYYFTYLDEGSDLSTIMRLVGKFVKLCFSAGFKNWEILHLLWM